MMLQKCLSKPTSAEYLSAHVGLTLHHIVGTTHNTINGPFQGLQLSTHTFINGPFQGLQLSQPAKVLTGGGDLREAQVDVPRLFAIPASDRIAGHCNRLPNSNGEYANANFSRVRLRAVTIKT